MQKNQKFNMSNYRNLFLFFHIHNAYTYNKGVISYNNKSVKLHNRKNFLQIPLTDRSIVLNKCDNFSFNGFLEEMINHFEGLYTEEQIRKLNRIKI